MGVDLNGRWKWIAGVATAILMLGGSGAGRMAWSAYEKQDLVLERHGDAIVRLTALAEAQQGTLERIEEVLVRLEAR